MTYCPLLPRKSIAAQSNATGKRDLAYRNLSVYSSPNVPKTGESANVAEFWFNAHGHGGRPYNLFELPFDDAVGSSLLPELRVSTRGCDGRLHRRAVEQAARVQALSRRKRDAASAACRGSSSRLLVFFVGAAAFTAIVAPRECQHGQRATSTGCKVLHRIDEIQEHGSGRNLQAVTMPDGPADKAGLIGGDVILKFDGQPVQNEDQSKI